MMKLTKSQSRTLLNTSLISAVPYSFSCIYKTNDQIRHRIMVELVCFKCAVIVYDETHHVSIPNSGEYIFNCYGSLFVLLHIQEKRSDQALHNGRIGVLQMFCDSVRSNSPSLNHVNR